MGYDLWVDMSGTILRLFDGTPIDINSIPTDESTRAILNNESGQICNQCMWCNKSLPNMTSPLILWGCSGKTLQGVSWRRRSAPQRLQRRVELLDKTRVAPAKSNISSSAQTQSAEGDLNSDTSDVSTFDNHNQSIYHSIVLFLKGSPELKYNIWGWRLDQLSFKHCQRHNGPRVLSLYLE